MDDLLRLTGLTRADLGGEIHIFCFLGDEPERLGAASSLEEAMCVVRERAFADGAPTPEDVASCAAATSIDDQAWRPLAFALSDDCLMARKSSAEQLVYLRWVLEEAPRLRLLVAWEA